MAHEDAVPGGRRPRRDRRGRGLRGPLLPPGVPAAQTRAEAFDELVHASLDRLERRWAAELAAVEVVVTDVPDAADDRDPDGGVALGHAEAPRDGEPGRIVVHRRGVEARAAGRQARETLVHAVLVEALADLLGLDPETVDPDAAQDGR